MLSILILDDSPKKTRQIEGLLSRYSEIPSGSWKVCTNVRDAKLALRERDYDLLILDIQIPIRQSETPQRLGGIDLLREIHERGNLKKPACIVGLTEYTDIRDKANHDFSDRLWSLVLYDAASLEWSERLACKLDYLIEAKKDQKDLASYGEDLCIVTALNIPEFKELLI